VVCRAAESVQQRQSAPDGAPMNDSVIAWIDASNYLLKFRARNSNGDYKTGAVGLS